MVCRLVQVNELVKIM